MTVKCGVFFARRNVWIFQSQMVTLNISNIDYDQDFDLFSCDKIPIIVADNK